jgi:hypothetical protein
MSWQEEVADRVKGVEEETKQFLPRKYAAEFKLFLDRFLPYALILLLSMIVLNFLGNITDQTSRAIRYLNWLLICYFSLRLAMAFRLAESDREFLRQHWFDALIIIPAFTLVQEIKALAIFEEAESGEATAGIMTTQNAGIAAQITKIVKIIKRSISF